MAKGSSSLIGLYYQWRLGKKADAIRAFVAKHGEKTINISAKVHPQLRALNDYLKTNNLREQRAEQDERFKLLRGNFEAAIKSEHGLKAYKIMERLEIDSKEFDFTLALKDFYDYKDDTSMPVDYVYYVKKLWLPFFAEKGCAHPKEFHKFRGQAELYVKTCKRLDGAGQKYSPHSYNMICRTLNQFMKFCKDAGHINADDSFKIWVSVSLEQQKTTKTLDGHLVKGRSGTAIQKARDQRTYSLDDLKTIKRKIDKRFEEEPDKKLNAYCLYFGVITGLRKGNFCGLRVEDILPEEKIPHFIVRDNVISGRSRGIKGYIVQENATKTSAGNAIEIPMVQPDLKTIVEVAKFIRKYRKPGERLFTKTPGLVNKDWKIVAMECGFIYLSPLQWRHSYATIGAINLATLYKGNSYFLQRCCLHDDYRTTQGYIAKHAKQFLDVFGEVFSPTAGNDKS